MCACTHREWIVGRVAEGTGLENQQRRKSFVSSNLTLSLNLVDCSDTGNPRVKPIGLFVSRDMLQFRACGVYPFRGFWYTSSTMHVADTKIRMDSEVAKRGGL